MLDMSIYNQTLRRLKQFNTADVPETEVEYNVILIYTIGQALDIEDKTIENDILTASGLSASGLSEQKKPVPLGSGSKNRPQEPPKRTLAASGMAPETPTTATPRLTSLLEKGRAALGTIQKDAGKNKQKSDKDAGAEKKKKEKATVVNVDTEGDGSEEYEYYSESSEPPSKKAKKDPSSSSKKTEEMDVHG